MITTGILNLLNVTIAFIITLLPSYTGLPTDLNNGIDWILGVSQSVAGFAPAGTIVSIFVLVMTIELAIALFHFLSWVFHWKQAGQK